MVVLDEDGYENVGPLVLTSLEIKKVCLLDFKSSYHMCQKKEYFKNLEIKEGGVVQLINNKT